MPIFLGVLFSLIFCALIGFNVGLLKQPEKAAAADREPAPEETDDAHVDEEFIFTVTEKIPDIILEYYRNPDYSEWVTAFFTEICASRDVASAILENTDAFDVPPALAFALSWEESRFNPSAINRGNSDGSIDRGLFQLNNRSFPEINVSDFFSIEINAYFGVSHLRYCLETGASEVSALAMYNAGTGRVRSTGAPEITLNYISRILENRGKIETRFHSRLIREEERRLANPSQPADAGETGDF